MMNLEQAKAYGKQVGVKYYVKSTVGGLYGGTKTKQQAQELKERLERKDKKNPFTNGSTVFVIEEVK